MRPYICLIEVGWIVDRWSVLEHSSTGHTAEISRHRFHRPAIRKAIRTAARIRREQGDNLRLEVLVFDKHRNETRHIVFGRDPRAREK